MAMNESAIWGIHGGRTGDADTLFLKHNTVALGWTTVGDLSKPKGNRDAFKSAVASTYQDKTPMQVANNAGQLFRFVHEMLVELLLAHYDQLDSRYKGLIPLKRVYVPEPLEESEG
jgi:restriction system protein